MPLHIHLSLSQKTIKNATEKLKDRYPGRFFLEQDKRNFNCLKM